MRILTGTIKTASLGALLVATASCGSPANGAGSGDGGGAGSMSSGGGSGGSGGLILYDADASTPGPACSGAGSTRSCCGAGTTSPAGTETCLVAGEFFTWGPCLSSTGATVSCRVADACDRGFCDAGAAAPPPASSPAPPPAVCTDQSVNNEPEILVGYSPGAGQTVGPTGQIKVWVCDENSPFIAPGEIVDNTTGAVTTPGNRTATAADGLLYEPALYIAPQSPTSGGTPHFPQWIKGAYNNNPPTRGTFTGGAPIDPTPPAIPSSGGGGGGDPGSCAYSGEFVWDVSALGLAPGSYTAVFSVHDGDHDRAIGCITIVITR